METIYAWSILSAPSRSLASALHTTRHGVYAYASALQIGVMEKESVLRYICEPAVVEGGLRPNYWE